MTLKEKKKLLKLKKATGVQEWADKSINIQDGCENNCTYCYARRMAQRFNRIPEKGWDHPMIHTDIFKHMYSNKNIMLPSTHDITENNMSEMAELMLQLLDRNNTLLIVSKPRIICIDYLCEKLEHHIHKANVEFRFTIGTYWDDIRRHYEPQAPDIHERIKCVNIAIEKGYQVSISCEPLLERDDDGQVTIIDHLLECKNIKEIWIGAMNYTKDAPQLDYAAIYAKYKDNPKIKWKDSFRKHLCSKGDDLLG